MGCGTQNLAPAPARQTLHRDHEVSRALRRDAELLALPRLTSASGGAHEFDGGGEVFAD
jgi:hypothetical protein